MESRGSVPARPRSCEGVWRFTAPATEASVPRARHTVRDLLRRQGVPTGDPVVHGLLLIVSELVTNVVRHAAPLSPELSVELAVRGGRIRVSVEDDHPCRPRALESDCRRTGGRGLMLVREITREAGGRHHVERTARGGKVVWAELPLTPVPAPVPPPGAGPAAAPTGFTSRRPGPSAP